MYFFLILIDKWQVLLVMSNQQRQHSATGITADDTLRKKTDYEASDQSKDCFEVNTGVSCDRRQSEVEHGGGWVVSSIVGWRNQNKWSVRVDIGIEKQVLESRSE